MLDPRMHEMIAGIDVQEECRKALEIGRKAYEQTGKHDPMLLVFTSNAPDQVTRDSLECAIVAFDGFAPDSKHAMLRAAGKSFHDNQMAPIIVIMVTEAWTSARTDCMPSEDPNRKEVLIASGQVIDARAAIAMQEISNGQLVGEVKGEDCKCESPILSHFWSGFFADAKKRSAHKYN